MVTADEDFVERVLSIVEAVPRGRVTTYGAIGDVVGSGPRLIGTVMARHGAGVPWWRVVRADGSLPPSHQDEARQCYLEEGTPLRRSGTAVDIVAAFVDPAHGAGCGSSVAAGPRLSAVSPSSAADLLRAYDAQLRGAAEVAGADRPEQVGPLWRGTYGGAGFVSYESLVGHDVPALVAATVAHYRDETDVPEFEWKTRGHDDLPDLEPALRDHGLVPDEVETVMVGEASALAVDVPLRDGLVVRRLETPEDLAAGSAVADEVFGSPGPGLADQVARGEGLVEAWGAFDGDRLVSSGRLVVVAGTEFAGLWGGSTLPSHRGLGVYRALTAARARSALDRGVRYLQSDCTAMSRPILERSGLVPVTTTTPWIWTRPTGGTAPAREG